MTYSKQREIAIEHLEELISELENELQVYKDRLLEVIAMDGDEYDREAQADYGYDEAKNIRGEK